LTAPLVGEADPRTFGNAVQRLRQLGASDQQIAEALRSAAAAAGIATESVRAEDRRRRERGEADIPFEEQFPELTEPLDIGVTDEGDFVPFDEAFPEPQ
jgi:alkylhydroperoxidase/carboxymuconolactone decarboxylase family protein YurZ